MCMLDGILRDELYSDFTRHEFSGFYKAYLVKMRAGNPIQSDLDAYAEIDESSWRDVTDRNDDISTVSRSQW